MVLELLGEAAGDVAEEAAAKFDEDGEGEAEAPGNVLEFIFSLPISRSILSCGEGPVELGRCQVVALVL